MCFRSQVLYFAQFFCSQAFTNCLQAVFSFSLTSYSILDWTRQFLLTALPDFSKIGLSYGNTQVNTQKPWFSAKSSLNCIRIWNHTQKYYESKRRQALPDGVFGHFNARKSYPFILLQNRRLEIHSKAINFCFKSHNYFIPAFILFIHQKCKGEYRKSYLQCRSVQGNIPQPFRVTILFSYFSGTI